MRFPKVFLLISTALPWSWIWAAGNNLSLEAYYPLTLGNVFQYGVYMLPDMGTRAIEMKLTIQKSAETFDGSDSSEIQTETIVREPGKPEARESQSVIVVPGQSVFNPIEGFVLKAPLVKGSRWDGGGRKESQNTIVSTNAPCAALSRTFKECLRVERRFEIHGGSYRQVDTYATEYGLIRSDLYAAEGKDRRLLSVKKLESFKGS